MSSTNTKQEIILTKEDEEQIELLKQEAVRDLFNGKERENFDPKIAREYIEYVYNLAGEDKPVITFAYDPLDYKIKYQYINDDIIQDDMLEIHELKNSSDEKESLLGTEKEIEFQHKLDEMSKKEIKTNPNKRRPATSHWLGEISVYSRIYFMWFDYINKVKGIQVDKMEHIEHLHKIDKNGIMRCYFVRGAVLALIAPEKVEANGDVLHNVHGPAIKYPHYSIYSINGVTIDEETFWKTKNQELTVEEYFKINNNDIRSAVGKMMEELYGIDYLFRFFNKNLKEVDTYTDKKAEEYLEGTTKGMNIGVYTLFKGRINETEVSYVRCYCPSTDRMFYLGVEPSNKNAKDAIASLYRVPRKLKNHIKYINRQGERFSTIFDEEGTKILKTLSKEDVADTVTISGDEYFNYMRYEY